MKTNYRLSIGTISSATLRPIDIALAIHRELDYANSYQDAGIDIPDPYENFEGFDCEDPFWESESASYYLEELEELMGELCPPYCYFGSTDGDGAEIGVWPMIDSAREDVEFVSVKSLADADRMGIETDSEDSEYPPSDFEGEWLHVNDHGNTTLYNRADGDDSEIWSVC